MKENLENLVDYSGARRKIKSLLSAGVNQIILKGEAGCGKTQLAVQAIKEFSRKEPMVVNLSGQTDVSDLIGKYVLKNGQTKWVDGCITYSIRNGKPLLLQEINATDPEVLIQLHSVFDDLKILSLFQKEGKEVIKVKENQIIVLTMNEEYYGVKELNRAFMDRFAVIEVPLPPNEEVWNYIVGLEMSDKELAKKVSRIFNTVNNSYKLGEAETFVSPRQARMVAKLIQAGKPELGFEILGHPNYKAILELAKLEGIV